MLRDIAMASCFGSAPEIAAFMVAYRLANLFRRLFGEGNLQAGFVPYFEELRTKNGEKAAFFFYRDAAFSVTLFLLLIIGLIEGVFWAASFWLPKESKQIVFLAMWMAPGLLFICLSSLHTALLQCQKNYFVSALAPLFFNGVWILAVFAFSYFPLSQAVHYLSCGIFFAFIAQWAVTARSIRKEVCVQMDASDWMRPTLFSSMCKKMIKPMGMGILGVGAMQLNSTLDAFFAYFAEKGGPAYLWYAIRVEQLPLAFFGVALSGALLPPLSRAMQEGTMQKYQELLQAGLRQAAALMIPCVFGIFALGGCGLNLLYGRGAFTSEDVWGTLFCLWAYGLGLLPSVFVLLLATSSYAKQNYRSPIVASLLAVGFHVLSNLILIFGLHLGAVSVALSTSLSSWFNLWLLCKGRDVFGGLGRYIGQISLISFFAALVVSSLGYLLNEPTLTGKEFARDGVVQMGQFLIMTGGYWGIFILGVWTCRIEGVFSWLWRPNKVKTPSLPR